MDYSVNSDRQNESIDILAEKIHTRLLSMMKELHQICVKNDITYYIIGGTALGARRHQGFIPWDDDVDIGMPRPDYERFSKLTKDKFPEYLEMRWYKNTKNSPFQFIKLIDNRTTLKEVQYNNYLEGLYIDIFPLDGTREDSFLEKMRRRNIWILHTMVIVKCATTKKKGIIKKFSASIIKTMDLQWLHNQLEKNLIKVTYNNSFLIANFLGAWGKREIMDKKLFGNPTLYKFEDTFFYGPEKIDEYLTKLYGDFMTPPPPEKQVFRHEYPLLDFDTPFRIYEENKNKP